MEQIELDPGAIDQLTNHQTQLDADGVMVGVSRQALDELLAAYAALSTKSEPVPLAAAPVEPVKDRQNDLRRLLSALGMNTDARSQSPASVFDECLAEIRRIRA